MSFSILDMILEAEGDDNQDTEGGTPANPDAQADAPANNDNNNDGDNNDNGDDDNFDINADLDDDNDNNEDGGDDNQPADDGNDDIGGNTGGGAEDSDDEPVKSNTDIFASLTAEEQQIKIMELKNQYSQLYNSCDDISRKINDLPLEEDSIAFVSKISATVSDLKKYISDYLTYTFSQKSFIENDIMFNRFLSIIQSVSIALGKFQKRIDKDDK
jgi:hypothetical protein